MEIMHPYLSGLSNVRFIPNFLSELRDIISVSITASQISPENMNISKNQHLQLKKNVTSDYRVALLYSYTHKKEE
jgi:hypothetical protein